MFARFDARNRSKYWTVCALCNSHYTISEWIHCFKIKFRNNGFEWSKKEEKKNNTKQMNVCKTNYCLCYNHTMVLKRANKWQLFHMSYKHYYLFWTNSIINFFFFVFLYSVLRRCHFFHLFIFVFEIGLYFMVFLFLVFFVLRASKQETYAS